MFVNFKHEILF